MLYFTLMEMDKGTPSRVHNFAKAGKYFVELCETALIILVCL